MEIRHPDLEALFGRRLGEIAWDQVSTIVGAATEESEILDFKQSFDQRPNADLEFGKDLCAFANARGGALIFGVREENGCARELTPIEFSESKEQQLRSWAHGRVFPSPEIEIQRVPSPNDPNRGCLLVIVAMSARQPHAVQKERDAGLRYVVRIGRDTRTLTESEVAERYGRRFQAIESRVHRLDTVFQARAALAPGQWNAWCVIALVPEVTGSFEVSGKTLKQLEQRARDVDYDRGLFGDDAPHLEVRAGLRRARLMALDHRQRPSEGYFELHVDGAGFGARYIIMKEGHSRYPGEVSAPTILASQLCVEAARSLRRLAEHAKIAGCSGAALVKASVIGPTGLRLGFLGHDFMYYAPSDPILGGFDPPPVTITIDDVLSNAQDWMVATRMLVSDLFNASGLPEVVPIHADGALNSSENQRSPLLQWSELSQIPRRPADR